MTIGIRIRHASRKSNLEPIHNACNKSLKSPVLLWINNKTKAKRNITKSNNKRQILLKIKLKRRE